MKNIIACMIILFFTTTAFSQRFYTKTGKINFDATSDSSPEKIEGINRTATCVIDTKTGEIQFAVLMKGFEFERALMEEHFNENYVESSKYPKSIFKGKLKDIENVNFSKDGTYSIKVKGDLSIHGETNEVETIGKIIIQSGKVNAIADFDVKLSDFKISIPGLVADKVSKTAKIKVACVLDPLKG